MANVPAPIAVKPSGLFDGNDGSWSSFSVRVGNPAQDVRVLVSTLTPETWVVAEQGCTFNDPSSCANSRGGLFDFNSSSSWQDLQIWNLVGESNLGYTQNSDVGEYGYDSLGLEVEGSGGVTLDHQVVAALATKDFYLGNLGLAARPINFDNQSDPQTGFLQSLKAKNKIPSVSYGYTAGASYRSNTTASLTLGGYDASRFTPNNVEFTFAPDETRDLVVGVQAITYSDSKTSGISLLPTSLLSFIDSTIPHIWLPLDACHAFEAAFGLAWDPLQSIYEINDTQHRTLLSNNASISFKLADGISGGPSVDITLPYASFDLEVSAPIVKNTTRYFPLRQASSDNEYTLGRAFLQEAFLTVDYERSNFSISQAIFPPGTADIVPILSINSTTPTTTGPGTTSPTNGSPDPSSSSITIVPQRSGLATSAIAGIAIAIIVIAIALASFGLLTILRRRRRRNPHPSDAELPGDSPKDHGGKRISATSDDDMDEKPFSDSALAYSKAGDRNVTVSVTNQDGFESAITSPCLDESVIVELGAEPVQRRPELPSPEPSCRSEMGSPEPCASLLGRGSLRSDISTPVRWSQRIELPSPSTRFSWQTPRDAHRSTTTTMDSTPQSHLENRQPSFPSPEIEQDNITSRTDLLSPRAEYMPSPQIAEFSSPMLGSTRSALQSPDPGQTRFAMNSPEPMSSPEMDLDEFPGSGNYHGPR
ncbi:hypothetical protein MMC09_000434 [Bachmanniomyces sp. S44760]|nr:hypothetical protein [Bachmanniomyces sp. S44760]